MEGRRSPLGQVSGLAPSSGVSGAAWGLPLADSGEEGAPAASGEAAFVGELLPEEMAVHDGSTRASCPEARRACTSGTPVSGPCCASCCCGDLAGTGTSASGFTLMGSGEAEELRWLRTRA